jgi:hypothetical protein
MNPSSDSDRSFRARLARFCRHPASVLVWFVLFSLLVKENYPFSHFPMYKGFEDHTYYYYVASENQPLAAKPMFKVSVPRIKKLHGNLMEALADERDDGTRAYQLGPEGEAEAGRRLLDQLRAQMSEKQRKKYADTLAKPLTLVRVDIQYDDGTFSKTPREVVTH